MGRLTSAMGGGLGPTSLQVALLRRVYTHRVPKTVVWKEGGTTITRTILAFILITFAAALTGPVEAQQNKPNILVIWGDDIGVHNVSAYNHGIMGCRTPSID